MVQILCVAEKLWCDRTFWQPKNRQQVAAFNSEFWQLLPNVIFIVGFYFFAVLKESWELSFGLQRHSTSGERDRCLSSCSFGLLKTPKIMPRNIIVKAAIASPSACETWEDWEDIHPPLKSRTLKSSLVLWITQDKLHLRDLDFCCVYLSSIWI